MSLCVAGILRPCLNNEMSLIYGSDLVTKRIKILVKSHKLTLQPLFSFVTRVTCDCYESSTSLSLALAPSTGQ